MKTIAISARAVRLNRRREEYLVENGESILSSFCASFFEQIFIHLFAARLDVFILAAEITLSTQVSKL